MWTLHFKTIETVLNRQVGVRFCNIIVNLSNTLKKEEFETLTCWQKLHFHEFNYVLGWFQSPVSGRNYFHLLRCSLRSNRFRRSHGSQDEKRYCDLGDPDHVQLVWDCVCAVCRLSSYYHWTNRTYSTLRRGTFDFHWVFEMSSLFF